MLIDEEIIVTKLGLFLDDERNPEDVTWVDYPDNVDWYVVRNKNDFMIYLIKYDFDYVSFDHDIQCYNKNGDEITGYDCLKSFCLVLNQLYKKIPKCFFHTQNPIGKKNMESYYNNFLKSVNQD